MPTSDQLRAWIAAAKKAADAAEQAVLAAADARERAEALSAEIGRALDPGSEPTPEQPTPIWRWPSSEVVGWQRVDQRIDLPAPDFGELPVGTLIIRCARDDDGRDFSGLFAMEPDGQPNSHNNLSVWRWKDNVQARSLADTVLRAINKLQPRTPRQIIYTWSPDFAALQIGNEDHDFATQIHAPVVAVPIVIGGTRWDDSQSIDGTNDFHGWIESIEIYAEDLTDEQIDELAARPFPELPLAPTLPVEPPAPPPPPPPVEPPSPPAPPIGKAIKVTPATAASLIAEAGENAIFELAPGTYTGLAIVPKNGQVFEGAGDDRTILDGLAENKRAFSGPGGGVTLRGLTVRNYRSPGMPSTFERVGGAKAGAQRAAIEPAGNAGRGPAHGWVLEDMAIIENLGRGVSWCNGMRVRRSRLSLNGHCGGAGRGRDIIIEDCEIAGNNRFWLNRHWESGGLKFAGGSKGGTEEERPPADGIVIRQCLIKSNVGPGIWTDWNVFDVLIERCSIHGNYGGGLQIEASALVTIRRNKIGDNLLDAVGSGIFDHEIMLQNSKLCMIEDNLIVNTRGGTLLLGQQNRVNGSPQGDGHIGAFTCVQNTIRRNVFIMLTKGNFGRLHDSHACFNNSVTCTGDSCPQQSGQDFYKLPPLSGNIREVHGITNAFCFLPTRGNDRHNAFTDNTFRTKSGTYGALHADYHETGRTSGDKPDSFLPRWPTLPTWDTPPGRL